MYINGSNAWKFLAIFLTTFSVMATSHAADMKWSGLYRIEGLKVENAELDPIRRDKAYILHHLILSPELIAADGLTIYGRFDIFNSEAFGQNNQVGQTFGNGPGTDNAATPERESNVFAQSNASETLMVTQLYLQWVQEYGALVVGRAPLHFGLGMTYNAGNGIFDHWYDVEDMVAYKFVLGNLFIMPILGKIAENSVNQEDDVNDYMVHVQYDNPETELSLGVFYQSRIATRGGNDAPAEPILGGAGSTRPDSFQSQLLSIFTTQKFGELSFGIEAGFLSGETGVITDAGQEVGLDAYGIAAELTYKPETSKWQWALKAGTASGDDPNTLDSFEGFIFDRNYDVAFLLFNHVLGQNNPFRTELIRDTSATFTASNNVDNEAISNVTYIAPSVQYKWNDVINLGARFTTGFLVAEPSTGTSKDVGYEIDLSATYQPHERLTWTTEAGVVLPGDAFKGGPAEDFNTEFGYGVTTKAAISF